MKYRLEAHADELRLIIKKFDTHTQIYYKIIDNESGIEIAYDEALRIIYAEKIARAKRLP